MPARKIRAQGQNCIASIEHFPLRMCVLKALQRSIRRLITKINLAWAFVAGVRSRNRRSTLKKPPYFPNGQTG